MAEKGLGKKIWNKRSRIEKRRDEKMKTLEKKVVDHFTSSAKD